LGLGPRGRTAEPDWDWRRSIEDASAPAAWVPALLRSGPNWLRPSNEEREEEETVTGPAMAGTKEELGRGKERQKLGLARVARKRWAENSLPARREREREDLLKKKETERKQTFPISRTVVDIELLLAQFLTLAEHMTSTDSPCN